MGLEVRCPGSGHVSEHPAEAPSPSYGLGMEEHKMLLPEGCGESLISVGVVQCWWCWTSTEHGDKGRTRVDKKKEIGEEQAYSLSFLKWGRKGMVK